MNHLLITDIARQDLEERLAVAQRDRLARSASVRARRTAGPVSRAIVRIRRGVADWRVRTQLGALSAPLCMDDRAESQAR
jgi:hypothetical protein